jgi:hypothetical protein
MAKHAKLTDPAARLITLLERGLEAPANAHYLTVWQGVFQLDKPDAVAIHHGLDMLRDLIDDVQRGIMQISDLRHETYLKPLEILRSILSRETLKEPWHPNRPAYELALNALEFCSDRLQANSPEEVIEQDELGAIRMQVEELLTQLKDSDSIPRKLRLLLFDLLEAIRRSIDEYLFRGTRGLRKQLFLTFAQLEEHTGELQMHKDTKEVSGFFRVLSKFDQLTSAALKVKQLASAAAPYLPLLTHAGEHLGK